MPAPICKRSWRPGTRPRCGWSRRTTRLRDEVRQLTAELEVKNRELARKNRLADLGQMASHVAHEVRNNLVPVTLYLGMLRRRVSGDAESLDMLEKVSAGFRAMDVMVNDLLHFTSDRDPQLACFPLRKLAGRRRGLAGPAVRRAKDPLRAQGPAAAHPAGRPRNAPPGRAESRAQRLGRDAPRRHADGQLDAPRPTARNCTSPTAGRACPRTSCRGSSSLSSPPSKPARAWGWPSSRGLPRPTAARSPRPTGPRRRGVHAAVSTTVHRMSGTPSPPTADPDAGARGAPPVKRSDGSVNEPSSHSRHLPRRLPDELLPTRPDPILSASPPAACWWSTTTPGPASRWPTCCAMPATRCSAAVAGPRPCRSCRRPASIASSPT